MARKHFNTEGLSLSAKLVISLSAIGVVLLVTAVISMLEYRSMSNYISNEIAANIRSINDSERVGSLVDLYNHQILATVGAADSIAAVTTFDREASAASCQIAFAEMDSLSVIPIPDSLKAAFDSYICETEVLDTVVRSSFLDSREWFFKSLQPAYLVLDSSLQDYNEAIHDNLHLQADNFQTSYYRSIMPVDVSIAAGLLLILLLIFFLLVNYVKPIYRMLDSLDDYLRHNKKYVYDFEGDDQLKKLNEEITDIVEQNIDLKRRVKELKERKEE